MNKKRHLCRNHNKVEPITVELPENDIVVFSIQKIVDEILEDIANILIREQFYLDNRKNNYPSNLNYNMIWIAGSCLGYKHNEIAKKHMSEGHINKHISSETREKMSKTWGEKANKVYTLISPENKIITFNNIRKFSRENNLTQTSIGLLLRGKIFYCNGWVKDFSNSYSFISPCGIVYNNIINLTGFCNEHNLKMKGMSKLHCERAKSYFGWIKNKQI